MFFKFALLVLIDQITKVIFTSRDFLILTNLNINHNEGLTFGLDFGNVVNSVLLAFGLLLFVYIHTKLPDPLKKYSLLILAGAVSNIIDRFFLGYVRDLTIIDNLSLNLADLYIFLGLFLLLFYNTWYEKQNIRN